MGSLDASTTQGATIACGVDRLQRGCLTMRKPRSMHALEDLGRVRLSPSFFLRDFLYSEIANFYGVPNVPENPDLAIAAGARLCCELLEPLQSTFGRIGIRSGYRSAKVTAYGAARRHGARV